MLSFLVALGSCDDSFRKVGSLVKANVQRNATLAAGTRCVFEAYRWPAADDCAKEAAVDEYAAEEGALPEGGASAATRSMLGASAATRPAARPPRKEAAFDTVLCADCLYDAACFAPLDRALR